MNGSQQEGNRAKSGPEGRAWLPPGFRYNTPKRNVLVAIAYLILLSIVIEVLRLFF